MRVLKSMNTILGIYISGVPRASHPFKVYEPEPDRRSVCSVSSSVHGRTSTTKSVQYEPSSRGDSVSKFSDVVSKYLFKDSAPIFWPLLLLRCGVNEVS